MKNTKKILMIIVMLLCFFMVDKVEAENNTTNIICNKGYLYAISNSMGNSEYANIARNGGLNLNIGNGTYNDGVHNFQYELLSDTFGDGDYIRCYNSVGTNNYAINDCNEKYADSVEIANLWAANGKDEQTLDPATGTITIKIALTGDIANNIDRIHVVTKYDGGSAGTVTKDSTNRQIIISGITPSDYKDYNIEIYYSGVTANDFNKNTDSINYCLSPNGMLHITTLKTKIKSLNSFTIEIPASFKNSSICTDVKNYSNTVLDISKFFSECYDTKTINYVSYQTLESDLRNLFDRLKEVFEPKDIRTLNTENLKCDDANLRVPSTNSDAVPIATKTTTRTGTYWAMTCTDTYYVESADPALVKAGEGVKYLNKVQIDRNCTVANIRQVTRRPRCSYQSAMTCHDSVTNTWRPDAGPNATFDNCVKKCDGGEYTQLCINACYNEVYKTNKSEIVGLKDDDFTKYVAKRIEYTETTETTTTVDENGNQTTTTTTTTSGDPVWNGVNLNFWQPIYLTEHTGEVIDIGHGASIIVTDVQTNTISNASGTLKKSMIQATLVSNGVATNVHIANNCLASNQPCAYATWCVNCPNCSDDPDAEYRAGLAASAAEVSGMITTAERYADGIVNYNISFEDTEDGQIYSVNGSTTKDMSGVKLDITTDGVKLLSYSTSSPQYGGDGERITIHGSFSNTITYYVDLPKQYTLKGDANTILVKGTDGYYQKVNNGSGNYKFVKYSVQNEKLLSSGENCYYTSLAAKDTNRETVCEKNSSGTDSLKSTIDTITELKTQIPEKATRTQLLNYWADSGIAGSYLARYSYNAYIAYSQEENYIVKNLKEEYDNINVSFEFESLGDAYGERNHASSKYVCYYGVYNMLRNTVKNECETAGLRYYYHEINLENIFDKREPRWNWTGTINGNKVTGAAAKINGYIVDPERLIAAIEQKGNTIYTNEAIQSQEMDYEYTLTNKIIQDIRSYNKTKVKGKKIPYTLFTLAASNNTSGDNFSEKVAEWLGGAFKSKEASISACNNTIAGSCYNYNIGGK